MRRSVTIILGLFLLGSFSLAADPAGTLKSGPQPGQSIPGPFHFLNINGAYSGDPHCLVCEYGLRPVVAVFARTLPEEKKPLDNLFHKLDDAVVNHKAAELRTFAAFLNEDYKDEEMRKGLVRKLENVAKDMKQVILCVGEADGPEKYNLNKDADVTVLVYNKHQVVANFAYAKDKMTDKDVTDILATIEKTLPKK